MSPELSNPDRSFARRQRDAALARLGSVRRWMIAAAAALTAGFAALVSVVAPGKTLAAKRSGSSSGSSASSDKLPPLASPNSLGLGGGSGGGGSGGGGGGDQPPQPPASGPTSPAPSNPAPAPSSGGGGGGGGAPVSGGS